MVAQEELDDEDFSIFYGSQTGTAEEAAWDLAREARRKGYACGDPCALNDISLPELRQRGIAIFVVSTTGQGDPPLTMRRFWNQLAVASLPAGLFSGLRFAVFGLGDTHYREFNYAARKLEARLKGLGAVPFFRLGLGNDQHDFGQEQELDPWAEGMWDALASFKAPSQPVQSSTEEGSADVELRYDVEVLSDVDVYSNGKNGAAASCRPLMRDDEFHATVVKNLTLCQDGHEQDVRNVRLATPGGWAYTPGDVAVVWPRLDPALVRRFVVDTLELKLETRVRIRPRRQPGSHATASDFPDRPLTLEEVFSSFLDISAVPTRHFFHVLSQYTTHEMHSKKLRDFASRSLEAKNDLYEYCKREKRSSAEVMWDFWTARPPLAHLISSLPLMRPRRYSIASSPSWLSKHGCPASAARFLLDYQSKGLGPSWRTSGLCGKASEGILAEAFASKWKEEEGCAFDLCVAVVNFTTKTGREGQGLCSTFLQRSLEDSKVLCSFEPGSLKLPEIAVPLILVCPGTGLSPCRALVQERHLEVRRRRAAGEFESLRRFGNGLQDIMFLGFRHQHGDFLYSSEWDAFADWLKVSVAFSRDHDDKKVYVQDMIEENGEHVCRLLDAGADIYVCGRSHPMPTQVFDSFAEVLHLHRGLSLEDAAARLRGMQRAQKYICDTWG
eukprot:TRINITY_DN59226_c0_g1_i1.p1 TRINITY_DN59226_c0_g1~~TRINITY_DN59226_c0_g1_i1.p1  ORF type:complete len:670 (-),score=120.83 TRINITY_DN59226_c0_g1_i1:261-2270(-)